MHINKLQRHSILYDGDRCIEFHEKSLGLSFHNTNSINSEFSIAFSTALFINTKRKKSISSERKRWSILPAAKRNTSICFSQATKTEYISVSFRVTKSVDTN